MRHTFLTHTLLRLALAFGATGALVATAPAESHAQAQSAARLQVTTILASNNGNDVAPQLQSISQRLRTQFGQFTNFQMHGQQSVSLSVGDTAALNIPGGRAASVSLQAVRNGTYELQVQVPGGATTIRSPEGGVFFIAGPAVNGGTLIIMIRS